MAPPEQARQNFMSMRRKSSFFNINQDYLWGLRGILTIQTFVWMFFKVFNPALTVHGPTDLTTVTPNTDTPRGSTYGGIAKRNVTDFESIPETSPEYQILIKKVLAPLLWDESLLQCFFILLSARTVAIHFLQDASSEKYARSLLARPFRVGIPMSVGLAIVLAIFSTIDITYFEQAAEVLGNPYIRAPQVPTSALASFNSIWDLMWVTKDYALQMGNLAWPSWTLWVVSASFVQSYTVYILMVILPYSRPSWHIQGLFMFAFGSWWFNSWGWYSATGLFLADLSVNPALRSSMMRGFKLNSKGTDLPYWFFAMLFFIVGTALKYIWTDVLPQDYWSSETYAHPAKYVGQAGNFGYVDGFQPYPRMDNWLIIVGVLLALEHVEMGRRVLQNKLFMFIGNRSMSYFVAQTILIYTAGLQLYLYCHVKKDMTSGGAKAVAFVTCLPATILGGELFYRVVDNPAQWFGHAFYRWTRE